MLDIPQTLEGRRQVAVGGKVERYNELLAILVLRDKATRSEKEKETQGNQRPFDADNEIKLACGESFVL